jgi:hypothetical protein
MPHLSRGEWYAIAMKSYDGCWTCRLRKKRCDEVRPECINCSTLQITCHFDDEKPTWMDGGVGQKEKAAEVKHEVRTAAARRRGTLPAYILEPLAADSDQNAPSRMDEYQKDDSSTEHLSFIGESTLKYDMSWISDNATRVVGPVFNGQDMLSMSSPPNEEQRDSELDRRFIMFYFDYFFPFLFPFYKPSLLEGGRGWIMELVVSNQAMWHTTLCLSTYFVSVALDGAATGHNMCKTLAWEKLLGQMSTTFMILQRNLDDIASSNTRGSMVLMSRIMGSIVQLQRFEIAVGNFENCEKHLDAASSLLRQIFHAEEDITAADMSMPTFYKILKRMGQPLWDTRDRESRAWSSDQAAFRFYSSLLVLDDVIASTCMNEPPGLLEYHTQLLTNCCNANGKPLLNLEDLVGCENWVILQIGETSALDAWKKSMRKAGQLDMMELVARALSIKQVLLGNLARLDAAANTPKTSGLGLFAIYNDQLPHIPGGCTTFVTRVWAHAALLYLSVVISGWQPGNAGIRENVVRVLVLLEQMPTPELLRTMVWPLCIAGCLAEPEEECRFRAMADALVPHRLFGAARRALEIMENNWKCRDELNVETDFATCVRSLGYMSLLV